MFKRRSLKNLFFLHFEWTALAAGLFLMALLDPLGGPVSYCPFNRLGIELCPGCGLGRSVAHIFRGEMSASFQMHPAGIAAVLIIIGRIGAIFHRNYNFNKGKNHEKNI
jgi:hypothetical protein